MKYRSDAHPVAKQIHGSVPLEIAWTLIPLGISVCIFIWGAALYMRIYRPPINSMDVYVIGKQWMWKAEHPGGQREINTLHVPINRPVRLTITSQDVMHSFSIPAFRIKREAVPGRYTDVWFEATQTGSYHLFCTQYCGTKHSSMIGEVTVMTPGEYEKWLAGDAGDSLAAGGEKLFQSMGCNSCHRGDSQQRGPNLAEPLRQQSLPRQRADRPRRRRLPARIDPPAHRQDRQRLPAHHAHLSGPAQRRKPDPAHRVH